MLSISKLSTRCKTWTDLDGKIGQHRFYWTVDDYKTTGCLNILCPGFVVTSQTIAPGVVLPTGSVTLQITKDGATGDWHVYLDHEMVGYFPGTIVNSMSGSTQVQMGGTVYAPPAQRSPPMGSGVEPVPGRNNPAAKFTWVRLYGPESFSWRAAMDVSNSSIYNVMPASHSPTGPEGIAFQYGGLGGA